MPMKGVISLSHAFRRNLKRQKKKVAALQMLGRLEEHLTKEFASSILIESGNSVFPLTNLGRKGEHKIDIALIEGDFSKDRYEDRSFRKNGRIRGFVEVKYLRNLHRIGPARAEDEIAVTLSDLKRQLKYFCKKDHAGLKVDLRNRQNAIYGLVIASYVRQSEQADGGKRFVTSIVNKALELGFAYEDEARPRLPVVYEDVKVPVLKLEFLASLYLGLWRLGPQKSKTTK